MPAETIPAVPLPMPKLDRRKFIDPAVTAAGEPRASVALAKLETLWINTGTLCNLTCRNCYIESSPRNDRLAYISAAEVVAYLDEIERERLGTDTIGFTGGEPFMNPELPAMLESALCRGFDVLVLTNAMKPMIKQADALLRLNERFGAKLTLRVSIDHYSRAIHERERGRRTWEPTIDGLRWLVRNGFAVSLAARMLRRETEADCRAGFSRLFRALDVDLDAADPHTLVVFPEMDETVDVPEITSSCWSTLGKSPADVMCASSRMVIKRRGRTQPSVVACTLLPYDSRFELGHTLAESFQRVSLNHPHCARFCVLGGASCRG